ncbi:MAG TPA: MurR/RpiR family transcriptional regulator [Burkholderiaceae bacterium]|nr:MurR/RpiR family transcriptional regulator [Burkholderiaceae bacterium]
MNATRVAAVIALVEAARSKLSRAEQRVADVVARDPGAVARCSIGALADMSHTSDPTVARFCRQLGFRTFVEFKRFLSSELRGGVHGVHCDVDPADAPADLAHKVFNRHVATLMEAHARLSDGEAVSRAAARLAAARFVLLCGEEGSAAVAAHAAARFSGLGIEATAYPSAVACAHAVACCGDGALLLVLAPGGGSKALLDLAQQARGQDAAVLALAPAEAIVATVADVVLPVVATEESAYPPLSAQLAHLSVLDTIAVSAALLRRKVAAESVLRNGASVRHRDEDLHGEPMVAMN